LDQKRRFQVQHRRFWRKNNDSRSDFAVFGGKTAFLDLTSAFLPENQRFQIQLSRFWTKNGDFKSNFSVFRRRNGNLKSDFFVLCWKNYFFWLNRSYSPETDFTKIINGNCGF